MNICLQLGRDDASLFRSSGRAGGDGEAISLVSADEIKQLVDIERLLKRKLERFEVEDFEPEHQLPETSRESGRANRRARESNVASLEKKRRNRRYGRSGHEGKNRGDSDQETAGPRSESVGFKES